MDEYFYHGDHLSSVVLVTDRKAQIVQQFVYMPYGELLIDNSSVDLSFRFSAKETDKETGLAYFGARYYDNSAAMWLGVDPLWEKYVGVNPYCYTLGNPVRLVDPDGRGNEDTQQNKKEEQSNLTFFNNANTILGFGLSYGESAIINLSKDYATYKFESSDTWIATNGKTYKKSFLGNQYVGSQKKTLLANQERTMAKCKSGVKWLGRASCVVSLAFCANDAYQGYKQGDTGKIGWAGTDAVMSGVAMYYPYGTAVATVYFIITPFLRDRPIIEHRPEQQIAPADNTMINKTDPMLKLPNPDLVPKVKVRPMPEFRQGK